MVEPTIAYMVTKGIYDEYRVLAVFTERLGAHEFADHHNLSTDRYSKDDRATVEEIDLYGAGWRRPSPEVLDGDVITVVDKPRSAGAPVHPRGAISAAPSRITQSNGGQ